MDDIKFIVTADGSNSLLNVQLNETYHSQHGAIQESNHVFINNGFHHLLNKIDQKQLRIFEVGFGTGLNALLTLQQVVKSAIEVKYTSIEAFPLERSIWEKLNYAEVPGLYEYFHKIHACAWNEDIEIVPQFKLKKLSAFLEQTVLQPESYDLVYFDAFAPNKQREMWAPAILEKVAASLAYNGVFVTYCAKGQLKRDLKSIGLEVETLPGPPGKKEMVRATKRTL
ncbi:tRNA (5-methylaminomethyl-2-thiouridine)(34)-methyltransferase MnmD [Chryseosolibacter indicus]|uniref:tRNA (5-methylaminomethyl-2-thiouridine)(34)-methyltransferase MnmD n=1 Tax=Chryseosolibacter indicus TaxID=2782351 RepID=A0ABS5VMF8_9BACT|nr:tRNA (5-methylaminomethyl-2-thiouridine)(34)-methyltransferase MnmD [Chryseosolibacter indicus]MBT1702633.1 tRNA (5-methylaminomethyl-2-thiouridine)(34)-methyltransferase MnmD [Chryseosolibacter indicus]